MSQRQLFNLRLGPDANDHPIVVEFLRVAPAAAVPRRPRPGPWSASPRWVAFVATVAIGGLVGLSIAAGSVSIAPPPAPTPRPGQPTPTAAPPALRVGNLVIQAPLAVRPVALATAESTPSPLAGDDPAPPAAPTQAASESAPTAAAEPAGADSGLVHLLLPFFQPPPRPTALARPPSAPPPAPEPPAVADPSQPPASEPDPARAFIAPIPSPGAEPGARPVSRPEPGSGLDDALRTASIANDQFNKGLHEAAPPQPPR